MPMKVIVSEGIEIVDNKIVIPTWVKHIKLDIGLGRFPIYSSEWLKKEPDTLVFGFEPSPDALKLIHEHWIITKEQMGKNFFAIPAALGDKEGVLNFYVTYPECESSSLLKPTDVFLKHYSFEVKKIEVPTFRLSSFFELLSNIEYIEYIKIDAQGMDLDIVKSGEDFIKDKVIYVTLEADGINYELSDSHIQTIHKYMLSINFIKIDHPNTYDPTYYNKKFEDIKDTVFICQKT
jgi:FkbM family methyltransferase